MKSIYYVFFKRIQNQFLLFPYLMVLFLALLLVSCKKDEIIVTTKSVTEITDSGAKCGGTVSFSGGFSISDCGICYGTSLNPTISDSHTEDHNGEGSFTSTMSGLRAGTKYYVRAYAKTSSGIIYGNQESFTTKSVKWLYYGNGMYENSWGLIGGGVDEWAVMFPSSMLSSNYNKYLSKVRTYIKETGSYTLKIYEGGSSKPTNTLMSHSCYISNTGWVEINDFTAVRLNTSKNLWVSLTYSHGSGVYPGCASMGINEPNARWKHNVSKDEWYDVYDNNYNRDLCWIIQVSLFDNAKGEGDETALQYSASTVFDICTGVSNDGSDQSLIHGCAK